MLHATAFRWTSFLGIVVVASVTRVTAAEPLDYSLPDADLKVIRLDSGPDGIVSGGEGRHHRAAVRRRPRGAVRLRTGRERVSISRGGNCSVSRITPGSTTSRFAATTFIS